MSSVTTESEKQQALAVIDRLQESATFEQMSEELALLESIRKGEADASTGRVVPHEEVERRSAK